MEKYLISNKTIALQKKEKQTIIYNVDNFIVINKSLIKVLNENCLLNGCSFEGRQKSAKKILNKSYKLPLIISNNITLLQLNSLRDDGCLLLVLNKIIDYEEKKKLLKITCINNSIFYNKISKNSFENLLISAIKLNNHLKWKKQ